MVKYFMGVLCRSTPAWPLWELTMAERTVTNFELRGVRCFVEELIPPGTENPLDRIVSPTRIAAGKETEKESLCGYFQWWYHPPVSQHTQEKRKETS
jgi:hypothetical protein